MVELMEEPSRRPGAAGAALRLLDQPLGDTVTVSFTTNLELMTPVIARLFPNGEYTITSNATFKNEPFPPSSTHKGDPKETL